MDFGDLPLLDGEVLPAGASDGEPPDEQRLTAATGNEGASFERAYHRAALLIWPRDRFADALLQAGVGAALPYLRDRIEACAGPPAAANEQRAVAAIAQRKRWCAPRRCGPSSATAHDIDGTSRGWRSSPGRSHHRQRFPPSVTASPPRGSERPDNSRRRPFRRHLTNSPRKTALRLARRPR